MEAHLPPWEMDSGDESKALISTGIRGGGRLVAPSQLKERASRAAAVLHALGVRSGDCVAILMRNDLAFLEVSLGAQWLGAYAVPVNWHFKPEEALYVLCDCDARVLVAHVDLLRPLAVPSTIAVLQAQVPAALARAYRLAADAIAPIDAVPDWEASLAAAAPYGGASALFTDSMIYTSGTTGFPKGVRREMPRDEAQRRLVDGMRDLIYDFRPTMRTAVVAPMYHSAPNAFSLRAARIAEYLELAPRFDAEELLSLIERERLTHLWLVPTMFVRLLKLPEATRRHYDLSSLQFVVHGAAPCAPEVKRSMIEWLGPIIHEYYGGTESGAVVYCDSQQWLAHPGTVGKPIPSARVEIHDEHGNLLEPGIVGEIFMKIAYYPDFTYHKLPERRTEVGRGELVTCGDIGYLDEDGFLYLCDRKRDMVISGGVNIYPSEIEAALCMLDEVHDCAVFGIPDDEFGESLIAVVEPVAGAAISTDRLRQQLGKRLADYKVPRRIEIRGALPREDSGKIFKRLLRDPYWRSRERAI